MIPMKNSETKFSYDAFVSFNKADKDFTERLVRKIESEELDGRKLKCFYSEWDIQPGENILLKIEQAQMESRFIVLVMSPEWLKSDWTTLERVIPVYEDPSGLKGRIIPIMKRKCEPPPSLRILKWIDYSAKSSFANQTKSLIARIKGENLRGASTEKTIHPPINSSQVIEAALPSPQGELLASNIFPVLQLPSKLYFSDAIISRRNEIWDIVGENKFIPPFSFQEAEGKIYSFSEDNPLFGNNEIVRDSEPRQISTLTLVRFTGYRIVIEILNRSMTAHMRNLGMVYDWNTKKTFFQLDGAESDGRKYMTWRSGKRRWKRAVVVRSKNGDYYAHKYCKATFAKIGNYLYLKIVPGWHFTLDGYVNSVDESSMTSLSTRWMNKERNHSLIDDVRFWASTLSSDSDIINLEVGNNTNCQILSKPIIIKTERGIEGDYRERLWYEEPIEDEVEVAAQEESDDSLTTEV